MRSTLSSSIAAQLEEIHLRLNGETEAIDRVAVALYDPGTDRLKTFVHSTLGESPLDAYEQPLVDVPSLWQLARARRERVIADLTVLADSRREHSRCLLGAGYRSSYTLPLFDDEKLLGFLFLDSRRRDAFPERLRCRLDLYARLIGTMLQQSLLPARVVQSAVRVAEELTVDRSRETGAHLERMARYARLIARELARERELDDEYVELVFRFAPLHDVGKIAIPDSVLLKPGPLDDAEFTVMQSHVVRGLQIVDRLMSELRLEAHAPVQVLRHVVLSHHEAVDGSGYPQGLVGEEIPLEARIAAVADVFDALTSARPYKPAWTWEAALDHLLLHGGTRFDQRCVAALALNLDAAREIEARFPAAPGGEIQYREGYGREL